MAKTLRLFNWFCFRKLLRIAHKVNEVKFINVEEVFSRELKEAQRMEN